MDPKDPWGTLGARVVEAKGARGARVGGGVTVVSRAAATLPIEREVLELFTTCPYSNHIAARRPPRGDGAVEAER